MSIRGAQGLTGCDPDSSEGLRHPHASRRHAFGFMIYTWLPVALLNEAKGWPIRQCRPICQRRVGKKISFHGDDDSGAQLRTILRTLSLLRYRASAAAEGIEFRRPLRVVLGSSRRMSGCDLFPGR